MDKNLKVDMSGLSDLMYESARFARNRLFLSGWRDSDTGPDQQKVNRLKYILPLLLELDILTNPDGEGGAGREKRCFPFLLDC